MDETDFQVYFDALRRRRSADEELSRVLGQPVEGRNLCELIAARAMDIELEPSDREVGLVGIFRSGPLAGSRVSLRFHRHLEVLRPPKPEESCDYHVVLLGPPDTSSPDLLDSMYLFDTASFARESQRGQAPEARKDGWREAEIFPRQGAPWQVVEEEGWGLLRQIDAGTVRRVPRHASDPEGRYPGWELLPFERLAEELIRTLKPAPRVTRTREAIQLDWKGSEGVVVLLTPEGVQVRIPCVHWLGPHSPRSSSRPDASVGITTGPEGLLEALDLIHAGVRKRRRQYRTCRFCGERFPPEHRFEKDVCDGCAERHLGVIH